MDYRSPAKLSSPIHISSAKDQPWDASLNSTATPKIFKSPTSTSAIKEQGIVLSPSMLRNLLLQSPIPVLASPIRRPLGLNRSVKVEQSGAKIHSRNRSDSSPTRKGRKKTRSTPTLSTHLQETDSLFGQNLDPFDKSHKHPNTTRSPSRKFPNVDSQSIDRSEDNEWEEKHDDFDMSDGCSTKRSLFADQISSRSKDQPRNDREPFQELVVLTAPSPLASSSPLIQDNLGPISSNESGFQIWEDPEELVREDMNVHTSSVTFEQNDQENEIPSEIRSDYDQLLRINKSSNSLKEKGFRLPLSEIHPLALPGYREKRNASSSKNSNKFGDTIFTRGCITPITSIPPIPPPSPHPHTHRPRSNKSLKSHFTQKSSTDPRIMRSTLHGNPVLVEPASSSSISSRRSGRSILNTNDTSAKRLKTECPAISKDVKSRRDPPSPTPAKIYTKTSHHPEFEAYSSASEETDQPTHVDSEENTEEEEEEEFGAWTNRTNTSLISAFQQAVSECESHSMVPEFETAKNSP
ncbi:uncharacterized protein VTP21DRAFT_10056 [Calcarisporiella thermophila]|uniref:uncharacterized protein n=1 Tax=Calcarisporiella thermophila TaxID=911321 RepID=UPI00374327E4